MPMTLVDSETAVEGLGLSFRKCRPGPEQELVDWFLRECPFRTPRGTELTVFCQPQLESGCPDIVLVLWSTAAVEKWDHRRSDLTRDDIRVLHYLYSTGPSTIEDLRATFGRKVVTAIERLASARTVRRLHGKWRARSLAASFAVRRIVAIEAKIGKWAQAVHQAALNTWFASDSCVLVPRVPRGAELLDQASDLGIHVLTRSDPNPVGKLSGTADLPRSYVSWLFNEWAWRQNLEAGV